MKFLASRSACRKAAALSIVSESLSGINYSAPRLYCYDGFLLAPFAVSRKIDYYCVRADL